MDAVAPQPGDLVLDKIRHSFFAYNELDPILRTLGVARLIVAGLQTNVCVEATMRAALERNYEVAVAENAVSTDGPALHTGSLNSMRVMYVEVAPWQKLIEPTATWSRAYETPDCGRDPSYWSDPAISALEGQTATAPTPTLTASLAAVDWARPGHWAPFSLAPTPHRLLPATGRSSPPAGTAAVAQFSEYPVAPWGTPTGRADRLTAARVHAPPEGRDRAEGARAQPAVYRCWRSASRSSSGSGSRISSSPTCTVSANRRRKAGIGDVLTTSPGTSRSPASA